MGGSAPTNISSKRFFFLASNGDDVTFLKTNPTN